MRVGFHILTIALALFLSEAASAGVVRNLEVEEIWVGGPEYIRVTALKNGEQVSFPTTCSQPTIFGIDKTENNNDFKEMYAILLMATALNRLIVIEIIDEDECVDSANRFVKVQHIRLLPSSQ